jgi:hypothetical protein
MSRTVQLLLTIALVAAAVQSSWAFPGPSPDQSAAASAASSSAALPEVTIRAKSNLESKISKFVNQVTVSENGGEGGLSRWVAPPVCPLVSGLSGPEGEFILGRVSEIARAAGVPLAGEQCRPNLYILVTLHPEDLLKGMEERNREFTFGYDVSYATPTLTSASIVDEFIATPRAVRVWYNLRLLTPEGLPPSTCYGRPCNPNSRGSLLVLDLLRMFSTVFVVVDQTRLKGVARGQFADYVSMVSLARLQSDSLGDAPTILRLFDGAPQAAPAGLTDWDQALLKSLYATDQESRLQRGQISRDMVPQIAH